MKNIVEIRPAGDPHWVGNGFHVRSAFSYDDSPELLSPFLLLDYGAPKQFGPAQQRRGVGAHPHRGFETVTVAYQGEIEHRDSTGGGGKIGPGDVQWMTAADGIVHEEFQSSDFTREGGTLEMAQLWVNLPAKHKRAKAGYQPILKAQIPDVALPGNAGSVGVIAGEFSGTKGPAKTFTPIDLWNVALRAGKQATLPLREGRNSALLVRRGELSVGGAETAGEGDLVILSRTGEGVSVNATADAELLVMSGEPIEEPVVGYGPFVMNTGAEIEQAIDDYQAGRMGVLGAR